MSISFRLCHTVFDGTKSNLISNLMLQPSQRLYDSRAYFVYTDRHGDFSHICFSEETSCVIDFLKNFIGIIHSCFCLFNLVGLAMKTISYLKQPNEAYFLAEGAIKETFNKSSSDQKWPMINMTAMKLAPPKIEPTREELRAIQNIKLIDLLPIWDQVGRSHSQYQKIKKRLGDWLTKIVPYPKKYSHISQFVTQQAAAQLVRNLLLIINQLNTHPNLNADQKERVILRIYDKAFFTQEELQEQLVDQGSKLENHVTCSPTWIEVAERVYKELKGAGTPKAQLFQYLQRIKEDIIYEQLQSARSKTHWNVLNTIRDLTGKEIALDQSNLKYNSTFRVSNLRRAFFRYFALILFYHYCSPQGLKDRLRKKIALDHAGKGSSGFDQEFAGFIKPYAIKHARERMINTEHKNFDTANYIMDTFYDRKETEDPLRPKFFLNDSGAEAGLRCIGVLV